MKNVVQQCEAIDFVFAGDIKPHKETQKFLSLKMSLQPIYLGPLNNYEAKALIQAPLRDYLTYEEPALERMLELTGCKPSLIQILCDDIFELLNLNESKRACITIDILDKLWETDLRNRVFEKFDPVLREFFDGLQGDERNLFCFLAHNPQSTADDISRILGISPSNVNSCLQRLLLAQKIIKDKNVYKISSGIIQEYGSLFLSCPVNNQFKINIFS